MAPVAPASGSATGVIAPSPSNGLRVTGEGAHDLHIHLLAAAPNMAYLEWHAFGLDQFMADPLTVQDGYARAPDRPGHGIAFDWDALAAHRPG